jgi:hypothetical protein
MATNTIEAIQQKQSELPTKFKLKLGCCDDPICPKTLFVKAILLAISEIGNEIFY